MNEPLVLLLSPQRGHCHGCSAHLEGSWLQVPGTQGKLPRSRSGAGIVVFINIIVKAVAKLKVSDISTAYTQHHEAKRHQGSASLQEGPMGTGRIHVSCPCARR